MASAILDSSILTKRCFRSLPLCSFLSMKNLILCLWKASLRWLTKLYRSCSPRKLKNTWWTLAGETAILIGYETGKEWKAVKRPGDVCLFVCLSQETGDGVKSEFVWPSLNEWQDSASKCGDRPDLNENLAAISKETDVMLTMSANKRMQPIFIGSFPIATKFVQSLNAVVFSLFLLVPLSLALSVLKVLLIPLNATVTLHWFWRSYPFLF